MVKQKQRFLKYRKTHRASREREVSTKFHIDIIRAKFIRASRIPGAI